MYCEKCGAQITEGATFCQKCGEKVVSEEAQAKVISTPEVTHEGVNAENAAADEPKPSKLENWWVNLSKGKMIFIVAIALIIVIVLAVTLLKRFGAVIGLVVFGVCVVRSIIIVLGKGPKEEKKGAWKWIILGVLFAAILIGANISKANSGVEVRDAYLRQYSESITVGQAFDNFFDNEEWDTYKSGDYKYVVFKGVCEYFEERADARITFKITGENFIVDKLEINGVEQNDFILSLLLDEIYSEY